MKCKLITTVSDTNHPGYLNLAKSLDKFRWDYDVLFSEYHGFGTKMVNAYNYATTTAIKDGITHLFIVDAYDVIVLSAMEEALDKIPNKDCILFNSERQAWPYEQWKYLYPEAKSSFKYLNGGMAFVEVQRFIKMFEENPILPTDNDQVNLSRVYLTNNKYDMKLDTNCDVFQTLCGTNWTDFDFICSFFGQDETSRPNRVENKETGTWPVCLHGNGQAPLDKIIELI